MQYRRLGDSGLRVSAIGLGSWLTLGDGRDAADAGALVGAARDAGVNLFDTADAYHRGAAETALGEAIHGLPRHHLVIASKCYFPMSDDVNDRGLSRKHIVESAHASLRRLRTDYLDLLQCHRLDPDTPLPETCRAMNDLIEQGKVLYWGVSAWPGHRIAAAVELCRAHGWHAPISDQPCYNLLDREIEREVLPACAAHGLGVLAYSPLAQGVLTGKYRPGEPPPAGSRAASAATERLTRRFRGDDQLARVAEFSTLAEGQGLLPLQLALLWCLRRAETSSVLVGARNVEQLQQSLQLFDTETGQALLSAEVGAARDLPADLEAALDALFPPA